MSLSSTSSWSFSQCASSRRLNQLAERPIDFTEEWLTPERIASYISEAAGYKLFYATERVNDDVMKALFHLAEECQVLKKMEKMQSGEILNYIEGFPSENRAALHTALRDFFDSPQKNKPAREAATLAKVEVDKLEQFLNTIQSFNTLVVIGIGGSELGPKALYLALESFKIANREVHFIGNIDPDDAVKVFSSINLAETLVCVVSKSGTTLETTVNEAFARQFFCDQNLNPKKHFLSVTGEGSPMDDKDSYLEVFHIWDWVGGRYSGSSVIGGVILGFACGFSIYWEFLSGAHAMDRVALKDDFKTNLPLLAALLGIWNHNFLHIQTCAIIPYSQALWRFPAHLQQLSMESNGKQIDRYGKFVDFATGPILWGEAGTNAQHSFYQLIHQGTVPICLEFIGFRDNQTGKDFTYEGTTSQQKLLSNLFAQAIALAIGQKNQNPNQVFLGNRPSHILLGERLTPFALGSLLSFFEHQVVFEGFLWNINSFDQEGVQLGKVLANRMIDRFKEKKDSHFPLGDAYLKELNHFQL